MNTEEILIPNTVNLPLTYPRIEQETDISEFSNCTLLNVEEETEAGSSIVHYETPSMREYSDDSLVYNSHSLSNSNEYPYMPETQLDLFSTLNECSPVPLESIPELGEKEDSVEETLTKIDLSDQHYPLSLIQDLDYNIENMLNNSKNDIANMELASLPDLKASLSLEESEHEEFVPEIEESTIPSSNENVITEKSSYQDLHNTARSLNHLPDEEENLEKEESKFIQELEEENILIEELEEEIANEEETKEKSEEILPEEINMQKKESVNTLTADEEENKDEINKKLNEDGEKEEYEEESNMIERSSSFSFDPLSMILSEEEESLWEDFGAYLSTLPPRCLSDSDSLSFDFPEELLDPPGDMLATKPQASNQKSSYLTKKQWQSCFDLFLNRNRPHIFKVTSKMLFKRQSSWADKNSDLLRSLQERLMKMRSLSDNDTYSNPSVKSSPTHTSSLLKRISNIKEDKLNGTNDIDIDGESSMNGLSSEYRDKDFKNKLMFKRSV